MDPLNQFIKNSLREKEYKGPDFIGIGVPKSGSTWFMRVLSQHPQIFITAKKEPHFFSSDKLYKKGIKSYCNLYKNATPNHVAGEFSTKYINFSEKSAHRIKEHFPEAKLICILRDPMKRAISHYKWLKQLGIIDNNTSLKEAIEINKGIIQFSKYAVGVETFLKNFDKNRILFLKTEDLRNNEKKVFDSVIKFLEINEFCFDTKNVPKSETIEPKFRLIENIRIYFHRLIRNKNKDWILNTKLALKFSQFYRKYNSKTKINYGLLLEEKKLLHSHFIEDLSKLKNLIDLDIKNWNKI